MNAETAPPADLPPLLAPLTAAFRAALGDALFGLYLHGSLAFSCYNPRSSDIDLVAVVNRPPTQAEKLALLAQVAALDALTPPKGIEFSVVLSRVCRPFLFPTPYELHYSPAWAQRYRADPLSLCGSEHKTDLDLAAHFTVLRTCGVTLFGAAIEDVFAPVPAAEYTASLLADIATAEQDALTQPVSVILNLCRVMAYLRAGGVLSKAQGGEWALAYLDQSLRPLIRAALETYRHNAPFLPGIEERRAFCQALRRQIDALHTARS